MRLLLFISFVALFHACSPKMAPAETEVDEVILDTIQDDPTGEEVFEEIPEPSAPDTLIYFRQSGCYGQCPVYEVLFLSDSVAHFSGKRNIKPVGNYTQHLSAEQMTDVLSWVEKFNLNKWEGMHPSKTEDWIPDLPSSTLIFRKEQGTGFIRHNHSGPEDYKNFEKYIYSWVQLFNWELD